MKLLRIGLCICACFVIGASMVGCANNSKPKVQYTYADLRTKKIYNQQQALLLFTTENPASSIISVKLTSKNGKFYYIVDGTNKKNIRKIYLIDAQNGKILKKEDQGLLDKTKITGFIDFVPVMDIDKIGAIATKALKDKDCYQMIGYSLYSEDDKNVYKLIFTNGDSKNPKYEVVYIDGVSGKVVNPQDEDLQDEDQDSKKSSTLIEDSDPILDSYLKSSSTN